MAFASLGLGGYGAPVWETYLWVALGSGLGGAARLLCSDFAARLVGLECPWGTLAVNVVGSLLIGLIAALVQPSGRFEVGTSVQQFLMVGVLGGYTTFSAFSLQTFGLLQEGHWGKAGAYVGGSVVLCLIAVAVGYALGSIFANPPVSAGK